MASKEDMHKPTKLEKAARIRRTVELLSQGKTKGTICRILTDQYGVCFRTAERYISEASKQILSDFDVDRKVFVARLLLQLQHVAEGSNDSKQYSNTLGAIGQMMRLLGLDSGAIIK